MKKQQVIKQVELILERVTEIDRERIEWEEKLLEIFPIKIGEKVSVMSKENKFIRFAFVQRIRLKPRGRNRKVKIEFDLLKCNKSGGRMLVNDYIKRWDGEYIQKIKS
jgi:hypothetical protein